MKVTSRGLINLEQEKVTKAALNHTCLIKALRGDSRVGRTLEQAVMAA